MDGIDVSQPLEQLNQPMTTTQRLVLLACFKRVLTVPELAAYTGLSQSYVYKLTSTHAIPHYRPQGKLVYFDRFEIDEWLKRNPAVMADKISQDADTHLIGKPLGRKGATV